MSGLNTTWATEASFGLIRIFDCLLVTTAMDDGAAPRRIWSAILPAAMPCSSSILIMPSIE